MQLRGITPRGLWGKAKRFTIVAGSRSYNVVEPFDVKEFHFNLLNAEGEAENVLHLTTAEVEMIMGEYNRASMGGLDRQTRMERIKR